MKKPPRVLVIDDEVEVCTFFDFLLQEKGFDVYLAHSGEKAKQILAQLPFDLAMVDLKLPDTDGIKLLADIKQVLPRCEVIIMTGYSTVKSAVEAIKLGAFDYIEKPFEDLNELEQKIDRALSNSTGWKLTAGRRFDLTKDYGIIAAEESPLIPVLTLAGKIAGKDVNVLIQGETGVGKEVVARFVHSQSHRAEQPFISVNCGAFTENLLESELFGHEKGAFTGAQGARKGIFQIADGGTLFLDEIGDASLAIQVKLLRVLETGEFIPVGGEKTLSVDVRVIAATNVNLAEAVRTNRFREDLFYRLEVVTLEIPPLRRRRCDIPLLVNHFIKRNRCNDNNTPVTVDAEAMEMLINYHWPGNVRELANVVTQAAALCDGEEIKVKHLPDKIKNRGFSGRLEERLPAGDSSSIKEAVAQWSHGLISQINPLKVDIKELLNELKAAQGYIAKQVIEKVLNYTGGDRSKAAKILNATPRMLRYLQNEK
ncbi:two-component system NtrC family response regulator [Desulfohalotomaculum tongense]|uniref:sigma-54-dependent transcriptional regulator n=1 Tax=Desulforadius tongensis TaxID=1216062 RepID=UPI00195EABC3|nr:sigma-54 dependent transcriptional regulator [Desulforadius tongensis]MBM7855968.1 two-component system NtrC family response regulator [Desulforadius tongensis]